MRVAHRGGVPAVAVLSCVYLLSYPLALGHADEYHLLYGAKRVLQGQVIYKDFFEIITPLGFYLFAGIYRMAGTTLRAARVGIALIDALGCALLFALVRRVASAAEAVLVVLVFAGLCIPVWPYASAHWMSTTLGLLVATVLLTERWQASSRARPLMAGVLTGIALCVQQQRGMFLAAWLPLGTFVLGFSRTRTGRWRAVGIEIAWGVAGAAAVTALVLGYAAWAASPALLIEALYGFAARSYAPAFAGSTPWAGVLANFSLPYSWLWLLRVSPLFLLVEGVLLIRRCRRPWDRADLVRLDLWLLGGLMALSVWYLPDHVHVSFVLPFLLIPGARLLHGLRSASAWARVPAGRTAVTVGTYVFALALVGKCGANVVRAYTSAPARFETDFGTVRAAASVESLFHAVRGHLVRDPGGRTSLFSYPDDAWLYLALPADDATRFSVFVAQQWPPELVQELIAVLHARRPGTVVLHESFSTDPVGRAIEEAYEPVEVVGTYRIYVRRADTPG